MAVLPLSASMNCGYDVSSRPACPCHTSLLPPVWRPFPSPFPLSGIPACAVCRRMRTAGRGRCVGPVLADTFFRRCQQLVYGERFEQNTGKPAPANSFSVMLFEPVTTITGDGTRVSDVGRTEQFQHLVATDVRHFQVGGQQVIVSLAQLLRHFPRARAGVAMHPVLHEYVMYHPQYDAVVVQRQHRTSVQSCLLRCCLAVCLIGFLRLGRQYDGEPACPCSVCSLPICCRPSVPQGFLQ